jgi:hypothetical protein
MNLADAVPRDRYSAKNNPVRSCLRSVFLEYEVLNRKNDLFGHYPKTSYLPEHQHTLCPARNNQSQH